MANLNRAATRRVRHVAQIVFSAFSLILRHVLRCYVIAVLASVFMCTGIAHAAGANYVYEELGRLVQVIAGDGSSTQYAYDAAGNITAVKADTVNTLAISSFTPTSGGAGTNVTIFGSGFSTTAASNTVTINNVAATVASASASQLNLTVPASATTGLITVSNANGSVGKVGVSEKEAASLRCAAGGLDEMLSRIPINVFSAAVAVVNAQCLELGV